MGILDYDKMEKRAEALRGEYLAASPYPHAVIDDFVDAAVAESVRREFSEVGERWKYYHHYNEKKLAITDLDQMPPSVTALLEEFQSRRFVKLIETLTGLEDLIADPALEGAGMHMIRRGGFLNIHNDFQTHTKNRTWSRQVNLILYLNHDWREEWRGHNEIWNEDVSTCERRVAPTFNRCVIFNTQAPAYHGHPDPLACPDHESRKSLAVYYYREEQRAGKLTPTDYRPRPDDSRTKRILIRADEIALRAVTYLKGRTGLSDDTLTRILKRFSH